MWPRFWILDEMKVIGALAGLATLIEALQTFPNLEQEAYSMLSDILAQKANV